MKLPISYLERETLAINLRRLIFLTATCLAVELLVPGSDTFASVFMTNNMLFL